MHKLVLFVLIQMVSLSVWSQSVVVKGRLTDSHNGACVELANVYIDSLSLATSSAHNGAYSLECLSEGAVKLCVSHIAYQPYCKEVILKKGINIIDIQLFPDFMMLNPYVVTGTGTSHRIDDVPVQTEIITQKDIDELSGRNLEEIISSISSSIDYTSSSMGANIKINGLGSDYVLILIDGKRMTGGVGGFADLSRINSEDIKQIEIVKGASSTLYGSDAIAGVINIITKKPKQDISVSNSTRIGGYGQLKQLNAVSINRNKWHNKTVYNYKQMDGYQLNHLKFNNSWESNHDLPYLEETYYRPANTFSAYTITDDLVYELSDKLSVNGSVSWYEKNLIFPFRAQMYNYYYNNRAASIGAVYKSEKGHVITFDADYGRYLYFTKYPYKYNESYTTEDGEVKVTYYPGDEFKNSDQTTINALLKGVFQLNKKHTLSAGAEMMSDYLEAQYRLTKDDVNAYTYASYAQDEYQITEKLEFVAGLRAIYHTKSGFMVTPKLTMMHKGDVLTQRFTYANGFKSPTLKQLYYYYESERMGTYRLYLGNEDLKPQVSHYFSWSNEYKMNQFSTGVNFYVNRMNNKIDYVIIPTSYEHSRKGIEETKMRYNIDKAQNLGVDFHFNVELLKQLSIGGGYSYVDARNLTEDIRLNGVAKHSITGRIAWTKKWQPYELNITLTGVCKSNRFYLDEEDDDERSYSKAFQLFKLTTNHKITHIKNWKITGIAGVDNILDYVDDSPYGSHYATLNPGRTYFVGLNISYAKKPNN